MEDDLGLSFGVIKFQFLAPLVKGVETNRHSIAATAMILNITNLEKTTKPFLSHFSKRFPGGIYFVSWGTATPCVRAIRRAINCSSYCHACPYSVGAERYFR